MYFGSVRFFKHLVISAILLGIILPTAVSVILFLDVNNAEKEIRLLKEQIADLNAENQKLHEPGGLLSHMQDNREYWIDFSNTIREKDPALLADFLRGSDVPPQIVENALLYPDLYSVSAPVYRSDENAVYLTFDDGPSAVTDRLLDVLSRHNVKATFFVCPRDSDSSMRLLKRIHDEGHTIGVHSYSHEYESIYNSVADFLEDFDKAYQIIYRATGEHPTIYRFPGGSVNSYNKLVYKDIIAEMNRRGFRYYDWNIDSLDWTGASWTAMYNTIMDGVHKYNRAIVLVHDSAPRKNTPDIIDSVIAKLLKEGYKLDKLDNDIRPVTFSVID